MIGVVSRSIKNVVESVIESKVANGRCKADGIPLFQKKLKAGRADGSSNRNR